MSKLVFKQSGSPGQRQGAEDRIKVIIADDDRDVHAVTRFVLKDFRYEGKVLDFLSAYSGAEAKQLLQQHPDASLILLDVVMEQDDSGLDVAEYIRKDLDNDLIRIIVRTGQPGAVPEEEIISRYGINDYREKTELTSGKFKSTMTVALRTHADLANMESFRARLEREVQARTAELLESNAMLAERSVELARARDAAEAASRAKSSFLANISHEIRTPMNSIIGMTHLALRNEHNPKQRDYLEKISISGEHLLGIIDDILDFSKIEAGKITLENASFNLEQVKQVLSNLVEWKAAEKKLGVNFDFDPAIPDRLYGDMVRLNQILINYINNAIKFTEQGGITIRARLLQESMGSALVRFEVEDTGIGLSREQQGKLFQPFQQADSSISRTYGGSGLGLAISKRLAELFEGEVGVESELGRGSIFWFTARITKDIPVSITDSVHGGEVGSAIDKLRGRRILLAEDHPFNQQVFAEFLEMAGATVRIANNGKEALELLRQEKFDCVLMDAHMPVMDGMQATCALRADASLEQVPVIAITAIALDEERQRFLAAGVDDFISKPFTAANLYTTVARWVRRG